MPLIIIVFEIFLCVKETTNNMVSPLRSHGPGRNTPPQIPGQIQSNWVGNLRTRDKGNTQKQRKKVNSQLSVILFFFFFFLLFSTKLSGSHSCFRRYTHWSPLYWQDRTTHRVFALSMVYGCGKRVSMRGYLRCNAHARRPQHKRHHRAGRKLKTHVFNRTKLSIFFLILAASLLGYQ